MIFFKSRDFQTAQKRGSAGRPVCAGFIYKKRPHVKPNLMIRGRRGGISYGASTFFLPDRCLMVSNSPHGGVKAPPNLPPNRHLVRAGWSLHSP